jgi:hypothetical protein
MRGDVARPIGDVSVTNVAGMLRRAAWRGGPALRPRGMTTPATMMRMVESKEMYEKNMT